MQPVNIAQDFVLAMQAEELSAKYMRVGEEGAREGWTELYEASANGCMHGPRCQLGPGCQVWCKGYEHLTCWLSLCMMSVCAAAGKLGKEAYPPLLCLFKLLHRWADVYSNLQDILGTSCAAFLLVPARAELYTYAGPRWAGEGQG